MKLFFTVLQVTSGAHSNFSQFDAKPKCMNYISSFVQVRISALVSTML